MKKILMLSMPLLVLALAISLLVVPGVAKDEESGYAVWATEADYLAGKEPLDVINSNRLTTTALTNKGYVLCYGDVVVREEDCVLGTGQFITIDLNSHTLSASKKIMVNGKNSSSWNPAGGVTIKNGKVVHLEEQFLQPRPNGEIYFENCEIEEKATSSNFIYDSSARIISFKDCTFTVNTEGNVKMIWLSNSFSYEKADRLNLSEDGKEQLDYVRNVVFENTKFIDNSKGKATLFYVYSPHPDLINISFTDCSSFNTIGNNFLVYDSDAVAERATVNVCISKSTKYLEKSIPFAATSFGYTLYDSIVRDGDGVIFGNKTEMLSPGEEQSEANPKLIWGNSGDAALPYQLCNYTCTVSWFDTPDAQEPSQTQADIAEGALLTRKAGTKGFYFKGDGENKRVYLESHEGWITENGSTPTLEVKVTDKETKLYAVTTDLPVSVAAFKSQNMADIIDGVVKTNDGMAELYARDISGFDAGAYVYFYEDAAFAGDEEITFKKNVTIDLGGHTLYKNHVESYGSAAIRVEGGAVVLIKNGAIVSSMTSVAYIENGRAELDKVNVSFDTAPAFYVLGGTVKLSSGSLTQCTNDTSVPAFVFANADSADINVDGTSLNIKGAFSASVASATAPVSIALKNLNSFEADSLYLLHGDVADSYSGAAVSFALDNVKLNSKSVFDISTTSFGKYPVKPTCTLTETCEFSAKPERNLAAYSCPSGLEIVGRAGDAPTYVLAPNLVSGVRCKPMLYAGLAMDLYIPTSTPATYVETVFGTVNCQDLVKETLDGVECYKLSLNGISVADCLRVQQIIIGFESGEYEYFADFEFDFTDYLNNELADNDPLVRKITASAISYISYAYEYTDTALPEEFAALLNSDAFKSALRASSEIPAPQGECNRGNIGLAFGGAQLYLSSDVSVRFNLRSDFTGTLSVNGKNYEVNEGKANGIGYIDVVLTPFDLYRDNIEISGSSDTASVSGEYSLSEYFMSMGNENGELRDMLLALWGYCYEAFVYDNGGVLPPYIDHIPPVDVELK